MNKPRHEVTIYPDERAERIAKILGPNSATAKALVELKARRAAGEDVVLLIWGPMIVVGPNPANA